MMNLKRSSDLMFKGKDDNVEWYDDNQNRILLMPLVLPNQESK